LQFVVIFTVKAIRADVDLNFFEASTLLFGGKWSFDRGESHVFASLRGLWSRKSRVERGDCGRLSRAVRQYIPVIKKASSGSVGQRCARVAMFFFAAELSLALDVPRLLQRAEREDAFL
jgi:hypothetical protein